MIASAAPVATAVAAPLPASVLPGAALRGVGEIPGAPGPVPADLAGWEVRGGPAPVASVPAAGGVAARLVGNASLVTPPFTVDPGAQTAVVRMGSRSAVLVDVVAEPLDGGPPVALATVPAPAVLGDVAVPVAAVAGRPVRLVVDPSAVLGATLDVAAVGPLRAPLPGWSLRGGAPTVAGPRTGPWLQVTGDPVEVASPPVAPPAGTRFLLLSVRGDGHVRADLGGGVVRRAAGPGWRDLRVPLAGVRHPVVLTLRADPDGGILRVRDIGVAVRQVRVRAVAARRRGRLVDVAADLGVAGRRLAVRLEDRGRTVATATSGAGGRVVLRARLRRGRPALVLRVAGDRTRLGTSVRVRATAAPGTPVRS